MIKDEKMSIYDLSYVLAALSAHLRGYDIEVIGWDYVNNVLTVEIAWEQK